MELQQKTQPKQPTHVESTNPGKLPGQHNQHTHDKQDGKVKPARHSMELSKVNQDRQDKQGYPRPGVLDYVVLMLIVIIMAFFIPSASWLPFVTAIILVLRALIGK